MRRLMLVACIAGLLLLAPFREARACWCGYSGHVGRVDVTQPMPNFDYCPVAWDPAVIREWASWLVRLDALLSEGESVDEMWKSPDQVFVEIVDAGGRDRERVKRARAKTARVFTVQVFASRTEAGAARVAARIDAAELTDTGFFFAGGVPASNPTAHVIEETSAGGTRLEKVLVGAFLDRRGASSLARAIRAKLRVPAFVRPL